MSSFPHNLIILKAKCFASHHPIHPLITPSSSSNIDSALTRFSIWKIDFFFSCLELYSREIGLNSNLFLIDFLPSHFSSCMRGDKAKIYMRIVLRCWQRWVTRELWLDLLLTFLAFLFPIKRMWKVFIMMWQFIDSKSGLRTKTLFVDVADAICKGWWTYEIISEHFLLFDQWQISSIVTQRIPLVTFCHHIWGRL